MPVLDPEKTSLPWTDQDARAFKLIRKKKFATVTALLDQVPTGAGGTKVVSRRTIENTEQAAKNGKGEVQGPTRQTLRVLAPLLLEPGATVETLLARIKVVRSELLHMADVTEMRTGVPQSQTATPASRGSPTVAQQVDPSDVAAESSQIAVRDDGHQQAFPSKSQPLGQSAGAPELIGREREAPPVLAPQASDADASTSAASQSAPVGAASQKPSSAASGFPAFGVWIRRSALLLGAVIAIASVASWFAPASGKKKAPIPRADAHIGLSSTFVERDALVSRVVAEPPPEPTTELAVAHTDTSCNTEAQPSFIEASACWLATVVSERTNDDPRPPLAWIREFSSRCKDRPGAVNPCRDEGRCALVDGKCIVPNRTACKNSTACLRHGRCWLDAGVCVHGPQVSPECELPSGIEANETVCEYSGQCVWTRGRCRPTDARHCTASSNCRSIQTCALRDDRCARIYTSDKDCEESCADYGLCKNQGEICVATRKADCMNSRWCRTLGWCRFDAKSAKCKPGL